MSAALAEDLAPTEMAEDRWLKPEQAAEHLQLSKQHLANLRVKHRGNGLGPGPDFHQQARIIRYRTTDLDAWMQRGSSPARSNVTPIRSRR